MVKAPKRLPKPHSVNRKRIISDVKVSFRVRMILFRRSARCCSIDATRPFPFFLKKTGCSLLPASRGSFFQRWKFLSRAAARFLQRENSSREPRRLFYRVIFALASRGGFFTRWYLLSRAAATFFQGEIASRELREDFAEKNWEKFGGLEKLYYVRGRKVRRWSAPKGGANKHRGKLPQILFKRSRCPTSSFLNGEKPFKRGH